MSTQSEFAIDEDISHLSEFNLQEARIRDLAPKPPEPTPEEIEAKAIVLAEDKRAMLQSIEELTALNPVEKEDFAKVRARISEIAESGNDVLKEVLKVAMYSDSHLMIQAAATMIRAIADTNLDIINLHEKKINMAKRKKEIIAEIFKPSAGGEGSSGPTTANQVNNPVQVNGDAIFVGTTAELNKFLKNKTVEVRDPDIIDVQVEPGPEKENDGREKGDR